MYTQQFIHVPMVESLSRSVLVVNEFYLCYADTILNTVSTKCVSIYAHHMTFNDLVSHFALMARKMNLYVKRKT